MTERSFRFERALCAATFVATSLASPPLFADNTAAAQALFEAGREATRKGDTAEACSRFRESYRLDPAAGTQLNLAVCEEKLGRLALSWRHYVALQGALSEDDSRRAFVEQGLSELETRVPRVVFDAEGSLPPGLTLRVADLVITESGFRVPIPIDPGTHTLEVSAPGHASARVELTLAEGERRGVAIVPPRPLAVGAPPQHESAAPAMTPASGAGRARDDSFSMRSTIGTVALGLGLASLVAGSVLGIGALNEKAHMERECNPDCSDEGLAAADRGRLYALGSTVAGAGALAFGAVGAMLWLWDTQPASAAGPGVGLGVRGTF